MDERIPGHVNFPFDQKMVKLEVLDWSGSRVVGGLNLSLPLFGQVWLAEGSRLLSFWLGFELKFGRVWSSLVEPELHLGRQGVGGVLPQGFPYTPHPHCPGKRGRRVRWGKAEC